VKRLWFGLELAYELEIEFAEWWDCSIENKHCNFILIFWINTKQIVGFLVVAFPRHLLCYVPLILFLYWLLFSQCLWASTVKIRIRFLSLTLTNCISLWIYKIFYMVSNKDCFLGREFLGKIWEFICKMFRSKLHIWVPWENIPKFKKKNRPNRSLDEGDITNLKSAL